MFSEIKKNLITWFLLLCFTRPTICCVARPGGSSRRPLRNPFYLHQKVPDIDEFSQGASGKPTEPIKHGSPAYERLPINFNPGIVFEHTSERSGDTRRMTKVCTFVVVYKYKRLPFRKLAKYSRLIHYNPSKKLLSLRRIFMDDFFS